MSGGAAAAQILDIARGKGVMIAIAESCTGGLVSAALTEVAGSSDVFDRGFVTYSYPSKTELLGVEESLLEAHGAVSEEVAGAMAEGALAVSDAQIAVAVTGVAGPGSSEAKPEGLVWYGVAARGEATRTECREFGALGRGEVRAKTVEVALDLLRQALDGLP